MEVKEVVEEVRKAQLDKAFSTDSKAKHFRILKRRNFESRSAFYAIIGRSERVPGKKNPQYRTLMNLGRLSDPEDEDKVIEEVGLTEDTIELIKIYFERKRLKAEIKEKKLNDALSESEEGLKKAKQALKE